MRVGRYVSVGVLSLEVVGGFLLGMLFLQMASSVDGQRLEILVFLAVFMAALAKGAISVWALLDTHRASLAGRVIYAGSLLPAGVVNAFLSYDLFRIILHEAEQTVAQVVGGFFAVGFALVALVCLANGLSYLIRSRMVGSPVA
jgi:hypothetical protein